MLGGSFSPTPCVSVDAIQVHCTGCVQEQFESHMHQGAPREYLRLLLCALSQPVGCGEEPMPTLQEILDAIGAFLSSGSRL